MYIGMRFYEVGCGAEVLFSHWRPMTIMIEDFIDVFLVIMIMVIGDSMRFGMAMNCFHTGTGSPITTWGGE